ncbi:MAG TPA: hypothetical protein VFR91_05290 [Dyella sp.]|nr:hypothetical protein [Dyella sp.]
MLFLAAGTAAAQHATAWYNDVALHRRLDASVRSLFRDERGQFVDLHGHLAPGDDPRLIATQFLGVFDGVPQDRLTTAHGYTLYAGCQPHNCAVAAAALTAPGTTTVEAVALIHWRCGRTDLPKVRPARTPGRPARIGGCDDLHHPTVTMFFPSRSAVDARQVRDLEAWAGKWLSAIGASRRTRYVTVALR